MLALYDNKKDDDDNDGGGDMCRNLSSASPPKTAR